jgi:hypothetical protein
MHEGEQPARAAGLSNRVFLGPAAHIEITAVSWSAGGDRNNVDRLVDRDYEVAA